MELTTWAVTILVAVLLCGALFLCLAGVRWILKRLFRGLGRLLSCMLPGSLRSGRGRSRGPAVQPFPSITPAPIRHGERRDVLQSQDGELVVTSELGDEEWRMGAYELHFVLNRPIAGLDRVETADGVAGLSEDGRFLVIRDSFHVVILDRHRDLGVRLRAPVPGHVLGALIDGSQATIRLRSNDRQGEESYPVAVTEADGFVVPNDWPGKVEMLAKAQRVP
jgi:hypothetical protein